MGWPNNYVQGVYNALGSLIGLDDGAGGQIGLAATSTWADKPLASAYIGAMFILDIGEVNGATTGSYWISNGTEWKPLNGRCVLYSSAVAGSSVTGAGPFTVLTKSLAGGLLGLNGSLRISAKATIGITTTQSVVYYKIGGVNCAGIGTGVMAAGSGMGHFIEINNRNSHSVKIGPNGLPSGTGASSGVAFTTATIDTSTTQDITITVTPGNAANTYLLEQYVIEIVNN